MPEEQRLVPALERMLHIKRIPMLAGLANPDVATIAEVVRERVFRRGAVVFREGERVGSVHFVVRGLLGTFRQGLKVAEVGPGAGVGALALFARDPLGSQVVAESETLTLELDADAVWEVLEDRFPILHHILRETSRRAIDLLARFRLDPTAGIPECPLEPRDSDDIDLVDRILFLRRMSVFERSSISALAELGRAMAQVRFEAGTALWQEGEPSPNVYLVRRGFVRARSAGGLAFRAGPGFALGALEALGDVPRWHEAVTETPVVALQGHVGVLVDVFEDNFEMAMDYLAVIAQSTLRVLDWSAARGEAVSVS
jgi:CRP-like cAMP-binding protein